MVVGGFRSFLLLVTTASYKSTRNLSSKWGF